jgi:hypothetical protein
VKAVTDHSFKGVLTPALAIIGLTIIGFSAIHLVVTIIIFNKDKSRLIEDYDALRMRYTDLLDSKDIERIFTKAGGLERLTSYLKFKRNLFAGAWVMSLFVFFCLVIQFTEWRSSDSIQSSEKKSPLVPASNVVIVSNTTNQSGAVVASPQTPTNKAAIPAAPSP